MTIPRTFDPTSPGVERDRAGAVEATAAGRDSALQRGPAGAPAPARSLHLVPPAVRLTVAEVAALSRRCDDTVRLALQRGLLPGVQSGPRGVWSVKRADALRWVDDGSPWQKKH